MIEPGKTGTVWSRLQQRMEQLQQLQTGKITQEAKAQRLEKRASLFRIGKQATASVGAQRYALEITRGHQRYGLPIESILEIHRLEHCAIVPGAPAFIRGVDHWRGVMLPLLDLGPLLGIAEVGLADLHIYVVVQSEGRKMGIICSDVENLLPWEPGKVPPFPDVLSSVPAQWILGALQDDLILINIDAVLNDEKLVMWRGDHARP